MQTLLITRPRYEPITSYLFFWNKELIEEAKIRGLKVIDLSEERARKKELLSIMKKTRPDLIIFNGHGSEDHIAGQDNEILIQAGENEAVLKNAIVFALSCQSARLLGKASVKIGAKAYIGYVNDFIFWRKRGYESRPLEDPNAKLFLEPTNSIGKSLIKGHTAGQAHEKGKDQFIKNIQKLVNSNSPDQFLARYLLLDYIHQVCLGDKNATVA